MLKKNKHTDWSRDSRNTIKLLEAGEAPGQTKITDYCELIKKIDAVLVEHSDLVDQTELKFTVEEVTGNNFQSFFNELLHNAEKNSLKFPTQRRHSSIIKQFATAFFCVQWTNCIQLHT